MGSNKEVFDEKKLFLQDLCKIPFLNNFKWIIQTLKVELKNQRILKSFFRLSFLSAKRMKTFITISAVSNISSPSDHLTNNNHQVMKCMEKDEILNVIQSCLGVVLETINYSFQRYKGAGTEVAEEFYPPAKKSKHFDLHFCLCFHAILAMYLVEY